MARTSLLIREKRYKKYEKFSKMCKKNNAGSQTRKIQKMAYNRYVNSQKQGVSNAPLRDWLEAEAIYNDRLRRFLWVVSQCWSRFSGWVVKNIGTITAILAMVITGYNAWFLHEQIRLENRPFIGIKKVEWVYKTDTELFSATLFRDNYGMKPAEDYRLRNCRVIILEIDDDAIEKKMISNHNNQYLLEHTIDERNRLVLNLMGIFATYFRKNLDAKQTDVERFLKFLGSQSKELGGKDIFTYDDKLLFRLVEVKQGIQPYYQDKSLIVFPNQVLV